jgi:hypothetical protein
VRSPRPDIDLDQSDGHGAAGRGCLPGRDFGRISP